MKVLGVVLLFGLIGVLAQGFLFDWSYRYCFIGFVVGILWGTPYGVLVYGMEQDTVRG